MMALTRRIWSASLAASSPGPCHAVLEADPNVAAHCRGHRGERHPMPPGAEHRPAIDVAEEAVRGSAHVRHVLGARADDAHDPDDALEEERRLDEPAVERPGQIVEVAGVVALNSKRVPLSRHSATTHSISA